LQNDHLLSPLPSTSMGGGGERRGLRSGAEPSRSAGRMGAAGGGPRAWGGRAAVSHGGRGAAAGEGEGRERDALHGRENGETEKP
jgi:hypothetical protein